MKIWKTIFGQWDDYTTDCLRDYSYFKENFKLIVIHLGKKWSPDSDPKRMQQMNFTRNLERKENTTMFLIFKEVQENVLDFPQELWKYRK